MLGKLSHLTKTIMVFWSLLIVGSCEDNRPNRSQSHIPSGIQRPRYEQLLSRYEEIAKKNFAEVVSYGQSARQRPLRLLRFQLPSTQTAKVAILITDAIHGDEYLGAALKVAELLATRGSQLPQFRDFMEAGGRVYVVPIVNPDGFAAGTRENANRQDLNRDFPDQVHNVGGLEQPETKNLVNYLSQDLQGTKLIMSLDYHCCQSTLIYPPGRGFSVSQAAQQQFRTLGAIVQKLFGYAHGSITQLIPYPAPGAAGDYLHKHFGSLALGFEGSGSNETQKYETHLQMWESYFAWAAAQIR